MSRITPIDPADATGPVEEQFSQMKSAFGLAPNMFKAFTFDVSAYFTA